MGQDQRTKALDSEHAIRRILPRPDCWRPPPENRATSAAFGDRSGEPSIDLYSELTRDECDQVKKDNQSFLDQGFGLAHAKVSEIRRGIQEFSLDGDVIRDPTPENGRHAVVSGTLTKNKRKMLQKIFRVCVEPQLDKYFKINE